MYQLVAANERFGLLQHRVGPRLSGRVRFEHAHGAMGPVELVCEITGHHAEGTMCRWLLLRAFERRNHLVFVLRGILGMRVAVRAESDEIAGDRQLVYDAVSQRVRLIPSGPGAPDPVQRVLDDQDSFAPPPDEADMSDTVANTPAYDPGAVGASQSRTTDGYELGGSDPLPAYDATAPVLPPYEPTTAATGDEDRPPLQAAETESFDKHVDRDDDVLPPWSSEDVRSFATADTEAFPTEDQDGDDGDVLPPWEEADDVAWEGDPFDDADEDDDLFMPLDEAPKRSRSKPRTVPVSAEIRVGKSRKPPTIPAAAELTADPLGEWEEPEPEPAPKPAARRSRRAPRGRRISTGAPIPAGPTPLQLEELHATMEAIVSDSGAVPQQPGKPETVQPARSAEAVDPPRPLSFELDQKRRKRISSGRMRAAARPEDRRPPSLASKRPPPAGVERSETPDIDSMLDTEVEAGSSGGRSRLASETMDITASRDFMRIDAEPKDPRRSLERPSAPRRTDPKLKSAPQETPWTQRRSKPRKKAPATAVSEDVINKDAAPTFPVQDRQGRWSEGEAAPLEMTCAFVGHTRVGFILAEHLVPPSEGDTVTVFLSAEPLHDGELEISGPVGSVYGRADGRHVVEVAVRSAHRDYRRYVQFWALKARGGL